MAVYLACATDAGHAFIDRELYLPRCRVVDPDRCAAAGVPDEVEFATKPTLARQMITSALDAGVGAGWVSGDEVYGADPSRGLTPDLGHAESSIVLGKREDSVHGQEELHRRLPSAGR